MEGDLGAGCFLKALSWKASSLFCFTLTKSWIYMFSAACSQNNKQQNSYLFLSDEKHRGLKSASLEHCLEFVIQQALCQKLLGNATETWAVVSGYGMVQPRTHQLSLTKQYARNNPNHTAEAKASTVRCVLPEDIPLLFHTWTFFWWQLFAHMGWKLWWEME